MPETQVRIGKIRNALGEFAQQQKEGRKFAQKNYLRKRNENKRVANDLRVGAVSDLPLKEAGGFDGTDFMGFQ